MFARALRRVATQALHRNSDPGLDYHLQSVDQSALLLSPLASRRLRGLPCQRDPDAERWMEERDSARQATLDWRRSKGSEAEGKYSSGRRPCVQ